ncbi:MAG: hypothetical protein HQL54_09445 [Magnetococcales bacterium]|nr:hypothetical protein [Magnetococcales bacterium]
MSCNPELVSAYLDGEVEDILAKPLTDHLLKCDHCQQMLARLARIKDSIAENFQLPDPEGLTSSVMSALDASVTTTEKSRPSLVRYGIPAALTAAAIVGFSQFGGNDEAGKKQESQNINNELKKLGK